MTSNRGRLPWALPVALALAIACSPDAEVETAAPAPAEAAVVPVPPATDPRPSAVLTVEALGEIEIELLPEVAPNTVENFVKLAKDEAYDGTTFHRVIPGFMIQGGDPNTKNRDPRDDGQGGPGWSIDGELSELSHVRGIVAMANKGNPDTAGSQFFIVHQDSRHLDGKYTVFGRVTRGLEHVDAITQVPRDLYGRHGPVDRPLEDVRVASVRIVEPEGTAPPANAAPAEDAAPEAKPDVEWNEGPS